jgi:hypothetical protein
MDNDDVLACVQLPHETVGLIEDHQSLTIRSEHYHLRSEVKFDTRQLLLRLHAPYHNGLIRTDCDKVAVGLEGDLPEGSGNPGQLNDWDSF